MNIGSEQYLVWRKCSPVNGKENSREKEEKGRYPLGRREITGREKPAGRIVQGEDSPIDRQPASCSAFS